MELLFLLMVFALALIAGIAVFKAVSNREKREYEEATFSKKEEERRWGEQERRRKLEEQKRWMEEEGRRGLAGQKIQEEREKLNKDKKLEAEREAERKWNEQEDRRKLQEQEIQENRKENTEQKSQTDWQLTASTTWDTSTRARTTWDTPTSKSSSSTWEKPKACWPLTAHEQKMFFRLQSALPNLIVLSQVSFGALLTAKSRAVRNTFDRKRADFVICDKSFKVLAVVELDDRSHDGREEQDANRDKLLTDAGYRVIRYRGIPDIEQVEADFK